MRVLTGIQPSGIPHLGNYFGAIRSSLELQKNNEPYLFIADLHALTTSGDPKLLRDNVRTLALDWLACGLDPEKTVFFRQSDVPEVTELAWYLANVTPVGLLERAHSYKDKLAKGFAPHAGLFTYPILMAADILLYQTNLVPVGKDQKQHLEITRDIAIKFNLQYGEVFTIPEELTSDAVAVIPGTDGQKMSKSYNNTIPIFGNPKQIRKTVMNIVTDCKGLEEPKDPSTCNVVTLYKLFATPEEVAEMEAKYRAGNYGYGHSKQALFEKMQAYFAPMQKRRDELAADPGYVDAVLKNGAERARAVAGVTLENVRRAVGII
ncbi:MAG: tryptophan--tRNA ligase [Victivallaceae bacterium]|nr:tryptophan--tRNA ligase [Victivallaceae bacterium]